MTTEQSMDITSLVVLKICFFKSVFIFPLSWSHSVEVMTGIPTKHQQVTGLRWVSLQKVAGSFGINNRRNCVYHTPQSPVITRSVTINAY